MSVSDFDTSEEANIGMGTARTKSTNGLESVSTGWQGGQTARSRCRREEKVMRCEPDVNERERSVVLREKAASDVTAREQGE